VLRGCDARSRDECDSSQRGVEREVILEEMLEHVMFLSGTDVEFREFLVVAGQLVEGDC
jgi:hypothetical protein